MEITIQINGQALPVEVSYEVYEYLKESDRKTENLSHQKRRHWDMRELDEYIIAAECTHVYIPTPEKIVCHRETMRELMEVLASCTETQQERFLLYALEGMSYEEIGRYCGCSKGSDCCHCRRRLDCDIDYSCDCPAWKCRIHFWRRYGTFFLYSCQCRGGSL